MADSVDSISQYFKSISNVDNDVTREEMHNLWKKAKRGDKQAKKRIMELNLRLVIPLAKRYSRPGIDFMDLIEEGNLGLLQAVNRFEPAKGYRFSTYATYWIEQHLRRAVEEQVGTIRVPPHAWENLRQWLKHWDLLHGKLGRHPTLTEMSKALKWSARQIKSVLETANAVKGMGSLGTPLKSGDEEGLTVEDTVVDNIENNPENILTKLKMFAEFKEALNKIDPREKKILEMRYGLITNSPLTLEEAGKKLKLSRERIRQIEERAVRKLRRIVRQMGLLETSEPMKKTPNLHIGRAVFKGPTNLLGEPLKKHPLHIPKKRS
jgi:RNA polymerase sigma factor (sigma-70 family)